MPAPQALMRARRPPALESEVAKTVGVYSGVVLDTVGFFANIIHPLNELEPFSFHMLDIQHRVDFQNEPFDVAPEARKHIGRSPDDVELAANNGTDDNGPQAPRPGIRRRPTYKEKVSMFISNGPRNAGRSHVSAPSLFAPLHVVGVASFLLTIALMVAAIIWEDGTALMGILLISFSASIIGYASWWQPILMRRSFSAPPPGDIVIRTREGAFLLIKCTETVARELYSGIDECHYRVGPMAYRGYMILGAIFIMPVSDSQSVYSPFGAHMPSPSCFIAWKESSDSDNRTGCRTVWQLHFFHADHGWRVVYGSQHRLLVHRHPSETLLVGFKQIYCYGHHCPGRPECQ